MTHEVTSLYLPQSNPPEPSFSIPWGTVLWLFNKKVSSTMDFYQESECWPVEVVHARSPYLKRGTGATGSSVMTD